jgi:hypothetical protein
VKARELTPGFALRKPGALDWRVIVVTPQDNGRTVLIDCVDERGHMPCVELYLDEEVDAYQVTGEGVTPMVLRSAVGPRRGEQFQWDGELWRIVTITKRGDEYHIDAVALKDETRTYFGRWSSEELRTFPYHPAMRNRDHRSAD